MVVTPLTSALCTTTRCIITGSQDTQRRAGFTISRIIVGYTHEEQFDKFLSLGACKSRASTYVF
jgi:hypothetical protein